MKNWYEVVNAELQGLAIKHDLPLTVVVGIFVSLSAQCPYEENMRQCKHFLIHRSLIGQMVSRAKITACKRILSGENPHDVWIKTSHKYHNFYNSLLLIDGAICIDTHIINMYLELHPYSMLFDYKLDSIFKSKRLLEPIRKWIEKQAKQFNVKTFEMQAILWCEFRGQPF